MNVKFKYYNLLLFILIQLVWSSNAYPIFLIHGFMGWGREELINNYYYWGGEEDLQQELQDKGFIVHTLSVGPISSNWERAIEAYTQIKGGCVDYGVQHSKQYNITQKPPDKCYPGLYPEWDGNHPIHIIGHSQGGLTARMLEYLLEMVIANESSKLLSEKHKNHIKSITTLSTPHNGTTLSLIINNQYPILQKISIYAGVLSNMVFKDYYDFDLEQWNLEKNDDETYYQFIQRIYKSNIQFTKNSAAWDLSIDGCNVFNKMYQSNHNTYYFSYSTSSSTPKYNSAKHQPSMNMSYYLRPSSILIGNDSNIIDSSWYENDGIVNTVSMDGPHDEKIIQYENDPNSGIWQHMGVFYYDHHQILLRHLNSRDDKEIINLYINHCSLLYQL